MSTISEASESTKQSFQSSAQFSGSGTGYSPDKFKAASASPAGSKQRWKLNGSIRESGSTTCCTRSGASESKASSLSSKCSKSVASLTRSEVTQSVTSSSRSGMPRIPRSDKSSSCSGTSPFNSQNELQKVLRKLSSLEHRLSKIEMEKDSTRLKADESKTKHANREQHEPGLSSSSKSSKSKMCHSESEQIVKAPMSARSSETSNSMSELRVPHSARETRRASHEPIEAYCKDTYGVRKSRAIGQRVENTYGNRYDVKPGGYILRG